MAGIGVGAAAKMSDLRHQRGPVLVKELGQLGKERDDVVIDDQLVEHRRGVGRNGAGPADKGQADAAFRLFHLIAERGVGGLAALRVAQRVAGTEDPVLDPDRTQIETLQQRIATHAVHVLPPFSVAASQPHECEAGKPATDHTDNITTAMRHPAITRLIARCVRGGRFWLLIFSPA